MKHLLLIAVTSILIISACKSKGGATADSSCDSCEDALIRFYGDPAVDGCGWVVDVSSTVYMPKNLNSDFYVDSLEVKIKYKALDSVNCGMKKNAFRAMLIEEIHKKK